MQLPGSPDLCPWTLLQTYVALTCHLPGVVPGSPVLRALQQPFAPLKSNTVGSITGRHLVECGVNTKVWGPHSTRGAAVTMYKKLGLSSEEVCEIDRTPGSIGDAGGSDQEGEAQTPHETTLLLPALFIVFVLLLDGGWRRWAANWNFSGLDVSGLLGLFPTGVGGSGSCGVFASPSWVTNAPRSPRPVGLRTATT